MELSKKHPPHTHAARLLIAGGAAMVLLLSLPATASAQIIIVPCEIIPIDPYCQEQCIDDSSLPWCEDQHTPVVLVPGMITSLNLRVIFADRDGGTWRFAPMAGRLYRALIERLEGEGYKQGVDLFIAHYDWRQPNEKSATDYLKPIIDQAKLETGASAVNIVAHSMGGLVARSYIQGDQYDSDVNKLILLGTPNEGASDAYVAWEGGEFPARWSTFIRWYLDIVEFTLELHRDQSLPRPLSFRAFFPSLKDLLPITDFVVRDGSDVATTDLTEQNAFLQQLADDIALIESRGVEVTTIAGSGLNTLDAVMLGTGRTPTDETLERWRDGHPDPDPPQPDTTTGDQTVLETSAHILSSTITIPDAQHDKLPEEAQEEVLEALELDSSGAHIAYDLPDSMLGVAVLSPVDPAITCGDSVLSADTNSFPDAEYVTDETDPDSPKLLVVADPPPGTCTVELTGTGVGGYSAITTYADEDETVSTTRQGNTAPGQVERYEVVITEDAALVAPSGLTSLFAQLRETLTELRRQHHITMTAFWRLWGRATKMHAFAKTYERLSNVNGAASSSAQRFYRWIERDWEGFMNELTRLIGSGAVDTEAAAQLLSIAEQIEQAGVGVE